MARKRYIWKDPHEAFRLGVMSKESEWEDWLDTNKPHSSSYETWLKKAYPIKPKPKPKPKPKKSKAMYPPPKTKKSHLLRKRLQSRIKAHYDEKDAQKKKEASNESIKKRIRMEAKLADSSANIPSGSVQSPSLKAERVKKEKAKELARQRKNLRKNQKKIKGAQILKKFMEQHQDL